MRIHYSRAEERELERGGRSRRERELEREIGGGEREREREIGGGERES